MTNYQTIYYWQGLDTLAQSDGTNVSYFEYDGLGSVRQVVDDAGEVGLSQTFNPYGNPYASAGSASTSLGYAGEFSDSNGFVFLRARYYNPANGRFFQTDPSRQEQNAYLYTQANPVNATDPTGNECWGEVCQNAVTQPPYYYSVLESRPKFINFEPGGFASLPTDILNYDPNRPFQYQAIIPPGLHACGLVNIAAILYNTPDSQTATPQDVYNKALEIYNGQIPGVKWHNTTDPSSDTYYADLIEIAKQFGLVTTLYGSVVDSVDIHTFDSQDKFYKAVRDNLRLSNKLIDLVGICGTAALCGEYKAKGSTLGNIGAYSAGHWIVITGVSTPSYWEDESLQSQWKWVRIYDPFDNWTEYYPADKFFGYQKGVLIAVGTSR